MTGKSGITDPKESLSLCFHENVRVFLPVALKRQIKDIIPTE